MPLSGGIFLYQQTHSPIFIIINSALQKSGNDLACR